MQMGTQKHVGLFRNGGVIYIRDLLGEVCIWVYKGYLGLRRGMQDYVGTLVLRRDARGDAGVTSRFDFNWFE